jgi:hypothetical protein
LQELREGMYLQIVSLGGSETGDEYDYVVSRQDDRVGRYR